VLVSLNVIYSGGFLSACLVILIVMHLESRRVAGDVVRLM